MSHGGGSVAHGGGSVGTVGEMKSIGTKGKNINRYIKREANKRYKFLKEQKSKSIVSDDIKQQKQCTICPSGIEQNWDEDEAGPKGDMFIAPNVEETEHIYQDIIDEMFQKELKNVIKEDFINELTD